jgi:hypothetical protein
MTALNSWALTSVADVKESLSIDAGDTTKDNLITRKINQATDMIESYCNLDNDHHFASTTYTNEEYDGSGTNQLSLRARPVITFTSLEQRSSTQNINDWVTLSSTDYFVDDNAGVIDALLGFYYRWNLYRVTYTAGYATIPSDLAEACATLAAFMVENGTTGVAVKRKNQGPKSIEYFQPMQGGSLIENLGLDDVLARYTNPPILEDK